ncbi:unnamed protein product, partial [Polarella glacialis]
ATGVTCYIFRRKATGVSDESAALERELDLEKTSARSSERSNLRVSGLEERPALNQAKSGLSDVAMLERDPQFLEWAQDWAKATPTSSPSKVRQAPPLPLGTMDAEAMRALGDEDVPGFLPIESDAMSDEGSVAPAKPKRTDLPALTSVEVDADPNFWEWAREWGSLRL